MPIDPYRNFKFEVEVEGFVRAGFSKITGLEHSVAVIDYREGGENETTRRMPGQSSFNELSMERGKSNDTDFTDWINEIFNLDNVDGKQGDELFRRTLTIYLKNKAGDRVKKWTVLRAWPSKRTIGDLDATANEVLIETLVVQNEGVREVALDAAA